jgi:type IV pilus assembly protein PilC
MHTYTYKAKTIDGNLITGILESDRRESVITSLRQKGYFPLSIQPQSKLNSIFSIQSPLRNRVTAKQQALFSQQLATLLKAGLQLTHALKTLEKQTANKYLSSVIAQLYSDIEQSDSLAVAMKKHPRVFSKVYTAIIECAETSGQLTETLFLLGQQLKAAAAIRTRIRSALIYPIFLLVVSALVVTVLTVMVIPKFLDMFAKAQQTLPLPTKLLITMTYYIHHYWWLIVLTCFLAISFAFFALKNENLRKSFHALLLKLPLIGNLNQKSQLALFARTLGSLLTGGVRITYAISTTKNVTNNSVFAEAISNIEEKILKGSTLASAVRQQPYFNEVTANMIAIGEDTGTLAEMLLEIAAIYEQEHESAISSMTDLLGPLMIVVLGLIIGFVVMAILMPIFETSTMVG